jgi:hypothetical protein
MSVWSTTLKESPACEANRAGLQPRDYRGRLAIRGLYSELYTGPEGGVQRILYPARKIAAKNRKEVGYPVLGISGPPGTRAGSLLELPSDFGKISGFAGGCEVYAVQWSMCCCPRQKLNWC